MGPVHAGFYGHAGLTLRAEISRSGRSDMGSKMKTTGRTRIKIGTILDEDTVSRLKERSLREGKSISAIIEDAVLKYDRESVLSSEIRKKAMEQLFSIRFNISNEDWNAVMDEDEYES
jgi:regulator of replication initiation timing